MSKLDTGHFRLQVALLVLPFVVSFVLRMQGGMGQRRDDRSHCNAALSPGAAFAQQSDLFIALELK